MTDDGMPPGSLSSFLSSLHENNTFEFIFDMGFFEAVRLLRRLAVCIVKLFVLVTKVNVN
jgi:hypothetical protein